MDEKRIVTVDLLGTFKTQMDASVDSKVAAVDTSALTYATEDDINALFTDSTGTDDAGTGTDESGT